MLGAAHPAADLGVPESQPRPELGTRDRSALTRARRRVRRWLRPPRVLRPTRAGWCFFAITFGVGFASLNTGNNLLYLVLSLMLAFLVLSGVLSESALRGIRVRRHLPDEAFAGSDVRVAIEISNSQTRVPSFAIVVEDCFDHGDERRLEKATSAGSCFALRVEAGGREHRRYSLRPARRGALRLAGVRVSTRFPFGLFSKYRMIELPGELLVYPELDPDARPAPQSRTTDEGNFGAAHLREGAEAAGLRDYETGDAMRRVHWKSSLRRSALLVREPEDTERREARVRLATAGKPDAEAFEAEVRRAASQVVHHIDAGLRVALSTDSTDIKADAGPRHRARLLGFLARVGPDARSAPNVAPRPGAAPAAPPSSYNLGSSEKPIRSHNSAGSEA